MLVFAVSPWNIKCRIFK